MHPLATKVATKTARSAPTLRGSDLIRRDQREDESEGFTSRTFSVAVWAGFASVSPIDWER